MKPARPVSPHIKTVQKRAPVKQKGRNIAARACQVVKLTDVKLLVINHANACASRDGRHDHNGNAVHHSIHRRWARNIWVLAGNRQPVAVSNTLAEHKPLAVRHNSRGRQG